MSPDLSMTFALNFDWLTNLLAILFVVACIYDARYDEYGTLTLSVALMSLAVMAIQLFVKPAFEMAL